MMLNLLNPSYQSHDNVNNPMMANFLNTFKYTRVYLNVFKNSIRGVGASLRRLEFIFLYIKR